MSHCAQDPETGQTKVVLSMDEAAAAANLSRKTLTKAVERGELRQVQLSPGGEGGRCARRGILVRDLFAWLDGLPANRPPPHGFGPVQLIYR